MFSATVFWYNFEWMFSFHSIRAMGERTSASAHSAWKCALFCTLAFRLHPLLNSLLCPLALCARIIQHTVDVPSIQINIGEPYTIETTQRLFGLIVGPCMVSMLNDRRIKENRGSTFNQQTIYIIMHFKIKRKHKQIEFLTAIWSSSGLKPLFSSTFPKPWGFGLE